MSYIQTASMVIGKLNLYVIESDISDTALVVRREDGAGEHLNKDEAKQLAEWLHSHFVKSCH